MLIHAVIIVVLATVVVRIYEKHRGPKNASAAKQAQAPAAKPHVDESTVKKTLDKEDARVAEMSDADKMAELRKKSASLESVNPAAVDAVASTVETVRGADKSRAYEPQKNVSGKFDAETATIYDIVREDRKDQPVFVYTLVDAEGRSMKAERKMDEMTPDDMRAYQVFEMGRNNKNMARLLKSAIMISSPKAKKSAAAQSQPSK